MFGRLSADQATPPLNQNDEASDFTAANDSQEKTYSFDMTGFGIGLGKVVFCIGETLPVVGNVCGVLKEVFEELENVHEKISEVPVLVERMRDVLVFLDLLPELIEHLDDTDVLVQELGKLAELLARFKYRVSRLDAGSLFYRNIKKKRRADKICKLDEEIRFKLNTVNNLFGVSRDKFLIGKAVSGEERGQEILNVLKEKFARPPVQIIDDEMEKKRLIAELKKLQLPHLNDDEIIKLVLEDETAQDILRAYLSPDHMATTLPAGLTVLYDVCIAIHTAPSLISDNGDVNAHLAGKSFEKKNLTYMLKDSVESQDLQGCICTTKFQTLNETLLQSDYFFYVGTGVGYEYTTGDVSDYTQANMLLSVARLPKLLVVCLKYGAKTFAESLVQATNAANVHAILWIRADANLLDSSSCDTVISFIDNLVNFGERSFGDLLIRFKNCNRSNGYPFNESVFGVIAGKASNKQITASSRSNSVNATKTGVVMSKTQVPLNNILFPCYAKSKKWDSLQIEELSVLTCDKDLVLKVFTGVMENLCAVAIRSPEEDSSSSSSDDVDGKHRHRAVVFEVVKKFLSMDMFKVVLRISNKEQLSVLEDSLESGDFSPFTSQNTDDFKIRSGHKFLFWLDFEAHENDECSMHEKMEALLKQSKLMSNKCFWILTVASGPIFFDAPTWTPLNHFHEFEVFSLPLVSLENLKTLSSNVHDEITFTLGNSNWLNKDNEINTSVLSCDRSSEQQSQGLKGVVKVNCEGFAEIVQKELCDGIHIVAAYEDDDNQIVLRLSISDVHSLQNMFGLILDEKFVHNLKQRLRDENIAVCFVPPPCHEHNNIDDSAENSNTSERRNDFEELLTSGAEILANNAAAINDLTLSVNLTNFANMFVSTMLALENLTPHQQATLNQCRATIKAGEYLRVHVKAPAGGGKTFLALHLVIEKLNSNQQVLYIVKNEPLCFHIIKWLLNRNVSQETIQNNFFVLCEPFTEKIKGVVVKDNQLFFNKVSTLKDFKFNFNSSFFVVVDEAHHLYASFSIKHGESNNVVGTKLEATQLHYLIKKKYPSNELMMLSDISQSKVLFDIDDAFNTKEIALKEVIRSSQRVMSAARQFATARAHDVKAHHGMQGPPLKVHLFPEPSIVTGEHAAAAAASFSKKDQISKAYIQEVLRCIKDLRVKFPGFVLSGHLAILVDDDWLGIRQDLEASLLKLKPPITLHTAVEAKSILKYNNSVSSLQLQVPGVETERVVFDKVDQIDGLEFLFVIALGFDRQLSYGNEPRSKIYRSITRAQLMFFIVNCIIPNGWLQFLLHIKPSNSPFSEVEERKRTKSGAANTALKELLEQEASSQNGDKSEEDEWRSMTSFISTKLRVSSNSSSIIDGSLSPLSSPSSTSSQQPRSFSTAAADGSDEGSVLINEPDSINSLEGEGGGGLPFPLSHCSSNDVDPSSSSSSSSSSAHIPSLPHLRAIESSEDLCTNIWDNSPSSMEEGSEPLPFPSFLPILSGSDAQISHLEGLLREACRKNKLDTVKELIQSGVNKNCLDEYNTSPAYVAAKHGHVDILKFLHAIDADLSISCTLVCFVPSPSSWLGRFKSTSSTLVETQTPLEIASQEGHESCVELISLSFLSETRPLHVAAEEGDKSQLKKLIKAGKYVDVKNQQRWTPLMVCALNQHVECMHALKNAGAHLYAQDHKGVNPLMLAVYSGSTECVNFLIEQEIHLVNARSNGGSTALMVAAMKGHYACMKALLMNGANVEDKNKDGKNALILACSSVSSDCVKLLLSQRAELNCKTIDGWTGLMVAAYRGRDRCLQLLLKGGADINMKNKDGNTALMVAALNGENECVRLLAQAGADPDVLNKDQQTAAKIARSQKHMLLARYLEKKDFSTEVEIIDFGAVQLGGIPLDGADVSQISKRSNPLLMTSAMFSSSSTASGSMTPNSTTKLVPLSVSTDIEALRFRLEETVEEKEIHVSYCYWRTYGNNKPVLFSCTRKEYEKNEAYHAENCAYKSYSGYYNNETSEWIDKKCSVPYRYCPDTYYYGYVKVYDGNLDLGSE